MAVVDRVRELVSPVVADVGGELYDIEFNGGVLRILVDRPGGIDIDAIKTISRSSSRILDEVDPIPGRYTLEVSSPGLERPLRTRDHYERALGERVKLKTFSEVDGRRRFEGTVSAVSDEHFELVIDGQTQSFSYDDVSKARTVFEWSGAPKPGSDAARSANERENRSEKEAD